MRKTIIIDKLKSRFNNQSTTPQVYKFSNKLWEFNSEKLFELISEILQKGPEIDEKMRKGLEKIEECLKIYLEISNSSIKNYILTVFGSIIIENGAIVRAINNYHNKPWFSNVSILMNSEELFDYITDNGFCYGQVWIIKI
jgi:hypothetical protein